MQALIESKPSIESFLPMVRRIVYKKFRCYCNCQDDIDELISEGYTILTQYYAKGDATKGDLQSYLYICIVGRLRNYIKKWNRERKMVKVDEYIHNRMFTFHPETDKVWLLDELEKYLTKGQTKNILRLFREGYTAKEISEHLGLRYKSGHVYNVINDTCRRIAVRIMRERSMGIIGSEWMFGCKDFD